MRIPEILRTLAGSAAIYAVVAACSSTDAHSVFVPTPIDGGGGAEGSAPDAAWIDAALDALTDPVSEAQASGGAGGSAPGYRDGDRLRARWRISDDGAAEFVGWHDPLNNFDCAFFRATDGIDRCMPLQVWELAYADAACSALVAATTCPLATYYRAQTQPATCDEPAKFAVYKRGELRSTGEKQLKYAIIRDEKTQNEKCELVGVHTGSYYLVEGKPESPTNFVGSKITVAE